MKNKIPIEIRPNLISSKADIDKKDIEKELQQVANEMWIGNHHESVNVKLRKLALKLVFFDILKIKKDGQIR